MNNKLHIAIFASAYHPSLGGVEELCRQLALELIHQGHRVIILTNRWPRDLPARETIDGIPIYRLPFRLPEGSAKAAISFHLSHHLITQRMLLILHENKIDMLHVQCVSSNAHYALIAQDRLKLPLVVTLQGELTMDANQIFQKSQQARAILIRSLSNAQVVTACSKKTLTDAAAFYGKPLGAKASVIYNGVNLKEFEEAEKAEDDGLPRRHEDTKDAAKELEARSQKLEDDDLPRRHEDTKDQTAKELEESRSAGQPAGGKEQTASEALQGSPNSQLLTPNSSPSRAPLPYIFALGRLAPQKAFDVLIKAFALSGVGQSHDLLIAGDGSEKERLAALIKETGQQESIKLIGRADRKQVASLLRSCEFFVVPSPAEPFGIVVIEAMAAGAPVIAINNAGPKEIITHGTNGLLVDRSEPELLAAAIAQLCADKDLRHRLAAAGKNRAEQFAWPKITAQYEAAYTFAAAAAKH